MERPPCHPGKTTGLKDRGDLSIFDLRDMVRHPAPEAKSPEKTEERKAEAVFGLGRFMLENYLIARALS